MSGQRELSLFLFPPAQESLLHPAPPFTGTPFSSAQVREGAVGFWPECRTQLTWGTHCALSVWGQAAWSLAGVGRTREWGATRWSKVRSGGRAGHSVLGDALREGSSWTRGLLAPVLVHSARVGTVTPHDVQASRCHPPPGLTVWNSASKTQNK